MSRFATKSGENDFLGAERRHELTLPSQRSDVSLKCRYLAFAERLATLETRHVGLIHLRGLSHCGLRLVHGLSDGAHSQVDAPLRAQATAEDAHRFYVPFTVIRRQD